MTGFPIISFFPTLLSLAFTRKQPGPTGPQGALTVPPREKAERRGYQITLPKDECLRLESTSGPGWNHPAPRRRVADGRARVQLLVVDTQATPAARADTGRYLQLLARRSRSVLRSRRRRSCCCWKASSLYTRRDTT